MRVQIPFYRITMTYNWVNGDWGILFDGGVKVVEFIDGEKDSVFQRVLCL